MRSEGSSNPFLECFRGGFSGILRWHELDELWKTLRDDADSEEWYVYALSEEPPYKPATAQQFIRFIDEINTLLRTDHAQDYCGIVYVDDREKPAFVKIYDPNNLGVVCGFSNRPPMPGWTLSKLKPLDITNAAPAPASRKRWWRGLFRMG